MNLNPRIVQARWMTLDLSPEDLPAVAAQALMEGFDGSALRSVAGLVRPTRRDLDGVVKDLFLELGCGEMSCEEAARLTACDIARRILARESPIRLVVDRIGWDLCHQVLDLYGMIDAVECADAMLISEEEMEGAVIAAAERLRQVLGCP